MGGEILAALGATGAGTAGAAGAGAGLGTIGTALSTGLQLSQMLKGAPNQAPAVTAPNLADLAPQAPNPAQAPSAGAASASLPPLSFENQASPQDDILNRLKRLGLG